MGKASRAKRARQAARDKAKQTSSASFDEVAALTKVPDEFSYALYQLDTSMVTLRGNEPKQKLEDGRLLIKCSKMRLVPIQEYKALVDIAINANKRQASLLEQIKKLREEAKKREALIEVVPAGALPKMPSGGAK